ncbi:MAG: hypothetical protein M1812_004244 [Candelaria pacifica]|nr:MAG: hypothetical protein M1812_004244 [Candelaria pacifica]
MSFVSDDASVVGVPLGLSPPSSRRASEILPPLAVAESVPTPRHPLNNHKKNISAASTEHSFYRVLSQYCEDNIGAATTDFSNSATFPRESMSPPSADVSSIQATNKQNETGWKLFGATMADGTTSMHSRSSEHSQPRTITQTSTPTPSQTPISNRSSDPFDLELNKLYPRDSAHNNLIRNNNSKLKRLTTQPPRPPRPTHSAGSSFAATNANQPDRPFIYPCPKTTPTRKVGNTIDVDYQAGLVMILQSGKLSPSQVQIFSVMANSLSALSGVLFNPLARDAITQWEMSVTKSVTEPIIIAYEGFHTEIMRKEEALKRVMAYLPDLKNLEDMEELKVGVQMWKERLAVTNIHAIDSNTINIFDYFSKFYDTTIYHTFLRILHSRPTHNIRLLFPHLNSIYASVEAVNNRARDLKFAVDNIRFTLHIAKEKLKENGKMLARELYDLSVWQCKVELLEVQGGESVCWNSLSVKEKDFLFKRRIRKREKTF